MRCSTGFWRSGCADDGRVLGLVLLPQSIEGFAALKASTTSSQSIRIPFYVAHVDGPR